MRSLRMLIVTVLFLGGACDQGTPRAEETVAIWSPQDLLGPPGSAIEQYRRSRIVAFLEHVEQDAPCVWPVHGPMTYDFAWRRWSSRTDVIEALRKDYFHAGVDIDGRLGDPIYAACAGTITFAGYQNGHGCMVTVRTPRVENGRVLYDEVSYAHLFSRRECRSAEHHPTMLVEMGQRVRRGEIIGSVGTSGSVTGSHVHVRVKRSGQTIDPCTVLPCEANADGVADSAP